MSQPAAIHGRPTCDLRTVQLAIAGNAEASSAMTRIAVAAAALAAGDTGSPDACVPALQRGRERDVALAWLEGSLRYELGLIGELRRTLRRQRRAIALGDSAALSAGVDRLGRTLRSLEEAESSRRAALATDGVTGASLAPATPGRDALLWENVANLGESLRNEATWATREIGKNRRELYRAMTAGDAFLVRQLTERGIVRSSAMPKDGEAHQE